MVSEKLIQLYIKAQAKSGLKVGDKVKITRKSEDHENGWNNGWPFLMDTSIGHIGVIESISPVGIKISGTKYPVSYPYFVLEKVN